MEKDSLHLGCTDQGNQGFNTERCIICQKGKTCRLTSTTAEREKILKAVEVRKDDVFDRLLSPDLDKDFLNVIMNVIIAIP